MNEAVDIFSLEMIKNLFEQNKAQGLENEEFRHNLDRYLRKKAISFGDTSVSLETIEKFLKFVVSLAKEELCYKALTVNVMQDVFDVSDIKRCEQLFSIIEDNISIWKAPFFFEACKNQILRMSNDLLKRLSRTVDTNFCGRILILLAKSLPLTEKSGLNLISQFNTANTTIYEEEKKEEKPEDEAIGEEHDMEVGEIRENHQDKDSTIPVDYTHYLKFWQLQEYFSNPLLCYEKPLSWKKFEHNLSEILNIFSTYKLDRQNYKYDRDREKSVVSNVGTRHGSIDEAKNSLKQEDAVMKIHEMDWQAPIFETDKDDAFFAKYLTNQKLFQLQIADSQFRRYFLVQCLILTQYLTLDIKFRDTTCFLSEDQKKFISEVADKCYKLLKETYPHGSQFSESIKKILNREKLWSQWKNDGCPDVLKNIRGQKVQMFKKKPTQNYDPEKIDLGNPELTRLWNVNPDIQSACKDTKRRFVPNVDRFVSDALDELDPEQQVDDEYKCINNEGWQWRASRLLLFETDQYITTCCAGTPAKALNAPTNTAKFLEEVLKNISINSTTKELKEKGEEIFKRIELKKQQDEEKAAALAADKKKEEAAALLAKKIEEEAKRASIEGPKEEPMETSHVEPTPVTPVPSSPKKLKLEPKQEVEERIEEQRKRKATVTSDETQPQKSVEKESSAEASSNSIAPKKLKVETKEHKESSSAPSKESSSASSKESASSKNPSQITDKEIQILSGLLHDYKKLAEVLEIPINISIPKHRKPESIVKSLLELWQRKDPSKATLSKLSMILATNEFLDERITSAIKELTKSREKDKHSSSRRREEK